MTAPILQHAASLADCDFNRAALHQADPIKCRMSTQNSDTRQASISLTTKPPSLDPTDPHGHAIP
jgi:hypothetical protein